MLNLIITNPAAMVVAIVGFWNSAVTINEGATGIVVSGGEIVRQLPPGAHYKLPFVERVVQVNPELSSVKPVSHLAELAQYGSCQFDLVYSYTVSDIEKAVKTVNFGNNRRFRSISIEDRLRDEIDAIAKKINIENVDRNYARRINDQLTALKNLTYEDGTKPDGFSLIDIKCSDPVANLALEKAQRPRFRPGTIRSFDALTGCGAPEAEAETIEFPERTVFTATGIPVDLLNLQLSYRVADPKAEPEHPHLVKGFAQTSLNNQFGSIAPSATGAQNLCSMLLNNADLDSSLARFGIELVALNPDTPQYNVHEYIEYPDDPSD